MAIPLEIRMAPRDVGRRRERARSVWLRRCVTDAAECTVELVRAHELQRAWRDLDVQTGSMVRILRKKRPHCVWSVS
jgi:hypothetical protein